MARKNTTPEPVAPKVEEAQERPPCLCGCGGFPKGKNARFIPGHDARYHAALKRAAAEKAASTERAPAPAGGSRAKDGATETLPEAAR